MPSVKHRYRINGKLDGGRSGPATVTLERYGPVVLFHVRAYRRRRQYTLPLDAVAAMVVGRIARIEVAEARAKRKRRRRQPKA